MQKFNGFEAKRSGSAREILPAGGYVAKILSAKEETYTWGNVIVISFDIADGDYRDFFATDYRNNENEDRKWRGTYRLTEPKDDGSEKDGWTKRTFGNAIWAIENSNDGYHWDWDETKFKGKKVGVLFRNREWEMNGNTGWTTECCALTSVEDIINEKFKMPKDKPLPQKSTSFDSSDFKDILEDENDDDLPFD